MTWELSFVLVTAVIVGGVILCTILEANYDRTIPKRLNRYNLELYKEGVVAGSRRQLVETSEVEE